MQHPGTKRVVRPSRRCAGITLIETICAAAILAVAISGLTNLSAASAALHQTGLQKELAVRVAERELATIVSADWADVPTFDGNDFAVAFEGYGTPALRALPGDADQLPGSVQILAPTGLPAELVEIIVRVDWISPHGPQSLQRRMRLSRIGSGS
jgi:hypothetical protein